jgi:sugar phosphate isomerase/epimerase
MLKVGVTTGLYYIARAEELATTLKKIGYGLTRGTDVIEISGDAPHEVTYTEGEEIRNLAEKQGVNLLFHGSLTIPMGIPERSDWRDAHDHIQKSIRSAVYSGCRYVLFHACLHFWLEMITYTTSKLEIVMCDHIGRFVSEVFYENKRLREWFIRKMWDFDRAYPSFVVDEKDTREAEGGARIESDIISQKIQERKWEEYSKGYQPVMTQLGPRLNIPPAEKEKIENRIREEVRKEAGEKYAELFKKYMGEAAREKMTQDKYEKRKWKIDTYGKLTDGYTIMAHYLFYTKDPMWVEMTKVYSDVLEKYKLDYSDDEWLDRAWKRAEETNDRKFKEFYYATVAAKFLEGHMKEALKWLEEEFIKKELAGKPELQRIAKNLKITIEMPDARDPKYAGLYLLWHPKQIYAAVKTIRKTLNTDRIHITMDWEHVAGHGIDPLLLIKDLKKMVPDFGSYVLSVHSNAPNPLHAHYPIELGDMDVYKLLYFLKETGMGSKDHDVYIIFERGGGDDPFRQAVDALKLCVKFLDKDTHPDNLPPEFFGVKMTAGDYYRQEAIMRDHRFEPLKDLLETPEEEWGLLSSSATRKGKTKEFKKEEMR